MSEMDFYIINRVKTLRTGKNISQLNLALTMELSAGAIGKIENFRERAKYSIRHLNMLAKALDCSPQDLLPARPMANDIVKITFRINRQNKTGNADTKMGPEKPESYYEVIKVEPYSAPKKRSR